MELEINQKRMDILCSMPFIYASYLGNEQISVITNPIYQDEYLTFTNEDGIEKDILINSSIINRTRKGFNINIDDTVFIYFLNLVPVTPMVIAQLNLVGK
ncbi:hypothetical protein Presley_44 [Acinetobacter phage Presley]|uniref:Uncharacterized protein n=1 Tax=Acinetobacter phage Presley TaxID=1406780 RepID=U5PWI9_9CAUD|nr:hypothetical protein Presley_44 [Acinetobacter phage Presley]AGY48111.1 hypothetical protein Presley_44 [Acinetobacter phage Presley]